MPSPLPRPAAVVALAAVVAGLVGCGGGRGEPVAAPSSTAETVQRPVVVAHPSEADVPALHPSVDDYPEATLGLQAPDGDYSVGVAVKVAHADEQRQHGLMEVEELPDGVGMVFLFAQERSEDNAFYMKDTLVPLSIAWVDAQGTIIDIDEMEPCQSSPCPLYHSDEPYRTALEVPQGWFAAQGIDVGWSLVLPDGLPAPE